jgi:hypothetical protein
MKRVLPHVEESEEEEPCFKKLKYTSEEEKVLSIPIEVCCEYIYHYLSFQEQVNFRLICRECEYYVYPRLCNQLLFVERLQSYILEKKNSDTNCLLRYSYCMSNIVQAQEYQSSLMDRSVECVASQLSVENSVVETMRKLIESGYLSIAYMDYYSSNNDSFSYAIEIRINSSDNPKEGIKVYYKGFQETASTMISTITFRADSQLLSKQLNLSTNKKYLLGRSEWKRFHIFPETPKNYYYKNMKTVNTERWLEIRNTLGTYFQSIPVETFIQIMIKIGDIQKLWKMKSILSQFNEFNEQQQILRIDPLSIERAYAAFMSRNVNWSQSFAGYIQCLISKHTAMINLNGGSTITSFMQPYEATENNLLLENIISKISHVNGTVACIDGQNTKVEFKTSFTYMGTLMPLDIEVYGSKLQTDDKLITGRRTNKRYSQTISICVNHFLVYDLTKQNNFSLLKSLMDLSHLPDSLFLKILLGIAMSAESRRYSLHVDWSFEGAVTTRKRVSNAVINLQNSLLSPLSYNPLPSKGQ